MNSPYKPPGSRVQDPQFKDRAPTWKAVSLGLAADVGGTLLFSVLVSILLGLVLAMQGMNEEAIVTVSMSAPYQVFGLFSGAAFTGLGGYTAARIANHAEYRHGLYLGIASLLFGELVIQFTDVETEIWLRIASLILVIPAALFGAHIRAKQKSGTQ